MTVNTHLTSLASDLVLSSTEKASISTSISTLATRLNSYFGADVSSHFQFGSNTRGTILPRKADSNSDIDYMVVFDISGGKMRPQTYLDRLKRFAQNKYATSEIKQSHPTVVLSLNHIHFELVPAIYEYGYQIPSPASSYIDWLATDPSGANQALIDKNNSENYQIKPLVRLIKYWNATKGHPYSSFELERYIVNQYFFYCTALKDYFYSFWEGFNYSWDTAQYVKNYIDSAKSHARKAKEHEQNGRPASAETEIRKIVPPL